jgi:hypothetical protein
MFDSYQTDIANGHTLSNSCVNCSGAHHRLDCGPEAVIINEVGLEGSKLHRSPNDVVNTGMSGDPNNCGIVKRTINNTLDLVLPTFEGLPDQNAQAHLNALTAYLAIKNVTPPLHLAVARRSLKGILVTTWGEAIRDQLKTFEDFRKVFLDKFWSLPCQAKVRLAIYQDKYDLRGTLIDCDHLIKYSVKAKYLDPPMSSFEFLNALKGHYQIGVRKAWIVAKPQTLQDAAPFLSDVMSVEENKESLEQERLVYPGQRDNYHRQRPDPRDHNRGGWNRNSTWQNHRPTGRYEGGRDNCIWFLATIP